MHLHPLRSSSQVCLQTHTNIHKLGSHTVTGNYTEFPKHPHTHAFTPPGTVFITCGYLQLQALEQTEKKGSLMGCIVTSVTWNHLNYTHTQKHSLTYFSFFMSRWNFGLIHQGKKPLPAERSITHTWLIAAHCEGAAEMRAAVCVWFISLGKTRHSTQKWWLFYPLSVSYYASEHLVNTWNKSA